MKIIFDNIFLKHKIEGHVENPERLRELLESVDKSDFIKPINGEEHLDLCHSEVYINKIKSLEGKGYLDMDTYYCEDTFKAACYSAGAAIQAAENQAFSIGRPPGHHALKDRAMGFCIFGNMAIAAKYLSGKEKKVAILDIDVHHGNGTQDLVKGDPRILFCSVHQTPFYPGTGLEGEENAINIPLPAGTSDDAYIRKLEEKFVPALHRFDPDYIGISAGFDSYFKDPMPNLGNMFYISSKTYKWIADLIKSYKYFFILEGGYNPTSVKEGVMFFMERL